MLLLVKLFVEEDQSRQNIQSAYGIKSVYDFKFVLLNPCRILNPLGAPIVAT